MMNDFLYYLNKHDLDEDVDNIDVESITDDTRLYVDEDYSETPGEADQKRSDAESVLGFTLTNNQSDYLATNWAEFYNDAKNNSDMKDKLIQKMKSNNILSDDYIQKNKIDSQYSSDEYDDDFEAPSTAGIENMFSEPEKQHDIEQPVEHQNIEQKKYNNPDTAGYDQIMDIANQTIDDFDSDLDVDDINDILHKNTK